MAKHLFSGARRWLSVDAGLLVLRVGFGLSLALAHGLPKLLDLSSFIASVEKRGIPFAELSAPFAALSEFVGGLLLALGWFTRPAALAILSTMLVVLLHVHLHDPFKKSRNVPAGRRSALIPRRSPSGDVMSRGIPHGSFAAN